MSALLLILAGAALWVLVQCLEMLKIEDQEEGD